MQVTGKIQSIEPVEQVSEKFSKREFVLLVDHDQQFPQPIKFELHNDRCDLIDPYHVGQIVTIDFNLRGRQWGNPQKQKTETFNTLWVWKIQSTS